VRGKTEDDHWRMEIQRGIKAVKLSLRDATSLRRLRGSERMVEVDV
jgi:hypothetical protein